MSRSKYFSTLLLNPTSPNSWFHNVIYDILDDILIQENGKIVFNRSNKTNKRIVLYAPRNFAKSTIVTVNSRIADVYKHENNRTAIVSSVGDLSKGFLREISNNLQNNYELIDLFGNLKDEATKWTEEQIYVKRSFQGKDPTFVALGIRESILSRRTDTILLDDVLTPENTKDRGAIKKIKQWWTDVLEPTLEPNGKIIAVGTMWSMEDLYNDFFNSDQFDIKLTFRSLMTNEELLTMFSDEVIKEYEIPIIKVDWRDYFDQKVVDSMQSDETVKWKPKTYDVKEPDENIKKILNYSSLWPDRWTFESLHNRLKSVRSVTGTASFLRQYMNVSTDSETEFVKRSDILQAKERGKNLSFLSSVSHSDTIFGGTFYVTGGVDLAISLNDTADYFAFATLAVRYADGHRFLLNLIRGRFTPAEQRRIIKQEYDKFNHNLILVESNGFQKSMQYDMAEISAIPIKPYHTSGEKYDETLGVNSLAVLFENQKFTIPYKDEKTQQTVDFLTDGLIKFGKNEHTEDTVMALWFANTAARTMEQFSTAHSVNAINSINSLEITING